MPSPVGLSFDDEFVAGRGEAVDGGLGQERVAHEGDPLVRRAVGRDDRGVLAVPGDGKLVEVRGCGLVQRGEREVVDDQDADGGEAAVLGLGAVVEPGGLELLEELVGAGHGDGEASIPTYRAP